MLKDNFNKFCLAVIALLVLLSLLFTIRASAEEYTAPEDAAGSSQDVPAAEEHPVTQVQGVQTYDPTLYDKLDKLQESVDALTAAVAPSDGSNGADDEVLPTTLPRFRAFPISLKYLHNRLPLKLPSLAHLKSRLRIIVPPRFSFCCLLLSSCCAASSMPFTTLFCEVNYVFDFQ